MTERIFQRDTVELDATKIEHYTHDVFGPITVFKDVPIARAIVQEYENGRAYKPGKELWDAAWTAEGRWAIAGRHPDTYVILNRDDIHGRTINARPTKSLKDPVTKRPMDRGILVDLEVFDNLVPPNLLKDMVSGKKTSVSIGFSFDEDKTPGTVEDEDDRSIMGAEYEFVQRNITIDHTAFGLEQGRCPIPLCGIGADEVKQKVFSSYGSESGIFDKVTEDYQDGYSVDLRQYDALQHRASIYKCHIAIRQKHALPPKQQPDAKNAVSQFSVRSAQELSSVQDLHSSWNNIYAVLREGVQTYDCKICKQILRVCNDDVSLLSDFASSTDLHKWMNKNASLVYNQMDIEEFPFRTEDILQEHVLLLQTARDYPFSSYQYKSKNKDIYTLRREVGLDPFGKWKTFEECVQDIMRQNPDYNREQAAGTCAVIEKRSKEKHKSDVEGNISMESLTEFNSKLDKILSILKPAEDIKDETGEDYPSSEYSLPTSCMCRECGYILMESPAVSIEKHCSEYKCPNCGAEQMYQRNSPESGEELVERDSEEWKELFERLPENVKAVIVDAGLCPECDEETGEDEQDDYDEFMVPHLAEDAVMSYAAKKALPDSAYAYIESGCEKEDGKTAQRCRHMPIHDEAHVRAALAALGGARTGKVPSYASKAKGKVCAAAKKFKIESEVCGTKKKKGDEKTPDEVMAKFDRTLDDPDLKRNLRNV